MPKAQNSPIRMYFLIQANESNGNKIRESECKACGLRMKGNHASNMERHVRRSHPGIYEKYLEIKQKFFNPVTRNYERLDDELFNEVDLLNFNPASFLKKKKCKADDKGKRPCHSVSQNCFNKENIIDACIELVTINGRPFSLMNDSGFKSLIEPMLSRVIPGITINDTSIKYSVLEKAAELKSSISENVKNKVLCLKLDCLTYCTRSFLGIHIQYYAENAIQLLTLGTVEISVKSDDVELSSIVWNILNQFDISKSKIYCIVIDNGSSFSKLLEAEEEISESSNNKPSEFSFSVNEPGSQKAESTSSSKEKSAEDSEPLKSVEDIQVITIYDEFDDTDNDLDSNTTDIIFGKLRADFIEKRKPFEEDFSPCEMPCATYTLQAAVNDILKTSEIIEIIKEAKVILKKLSHPQFHESLKQSNINIPTLDFPGRWKSIFGMLENLLEMKLVCISLGLTSENSRFWIELENCLLCLKSCKQVSDILETEQYTLCDVYKLWFNSILETSKIDSTIAEILVKQMRLKQEALFENITFLSAVFLDPRFNKMVLNEQQKSQAIIHLTSLYENFFYDNLTSDQNQVNDNDLNHMGEEDELEKIFREQEYYNRQRSEGNSKLKQIEYALKNFCDNEPRLKTSENIFNFWEKKKYLYPEIYNLVSVILSVPATQKSITTLMPQVRYIFNNDKECIDSHLLNDVLLIRSNSQLLKLSYNVFV